MEDFRFEKEISGHQSQQNNNSNVIAQPECELPRLSDRIQSLREVALALLSEVDTLDDQPRITAQLKVNLHAEVRRYEINLIQRALECTQGQQVRAARLLGIKVTTLNSKIKRFGIRPQQFVADAPLRLERAPMSYQDRIESAA